jgi:hypothetical protein
MKRKSVLNNLTVIGREKTFSGTIVIESGIIADILED